MHHSKDRGASSHDRAAGGHSFTCRQALRGRRVAGLSKGCAHSRARLALRGLPACDQAGNTDQAGVVRGTGVDRRQAAKVVRLSLVGRACL